MTGGSVTNCGGSGIFIDNTNITTRRITVQGHPLVDGCGTVGDFTSTGGANGSMWFDQPNGQRKLRKAGAWVAL